MSWNCLFETMQSLVDGANLQAAWFSVGNGGKLLNADFITVVVAGSILLPGCILQFFRIGLIEGDTTWGIYGLFSLIFFILCAPFLLFAGFVERDRATNFWSWGFRYCLPLIWYLILFLGTFYLSITSGQSDWLTAVFTSVFIFWILTLAWLGSWILNAIYIAGWAIYFSHWLLGTVESEMVRVISQAFSNDASASIVVLGTVFVSIINGIIDLIEIANG